MDPNKVVTKEQVQSFIRSGDEIWDTCKEDTEQASMELLNVALCRCLDDAGILLSSDTEIWPDVHKIFDEFQDNRLENIPCDYNVINGNIGCGLPDSLDDNEEFNNYVEYLDPGDGNFMDCMKDGDHVDTLHRCKVDEDVEDDVNVNDEDVKDYKQIETLHGGEIVEDVEDDEHEETLHGCEIDDNPKPMVE